jgi:hypothetical protein
MSKRAHYIHHVRILDVKIPRFSFFPEKQWYHLCTDDGRVLDSLPFLCQSHKEGCCQAVLQFDKFPMPMGSARVGGIVLADENSEAKVILPWIMGAVTGKIIQNCMLSCGPMLGLPCLVHNGDDVTLEKPIHEILSVLNLPESSYHILCEYIQVTYQFAPI